MSISTTTTLRCDHEGCPAAIEVTDSAGPITDVSHQAIRQGWQFVAVGWPFALNRHLCPEHRTDKDDQ